MATKTSKTTPVQTKADMIRKYVKKGLPTTEIMKKVTKVYATCYRVEVSRIQSQFQTA